jgi:hypothetical protein
LDCFKAHVGHVQHAYDPAKNLRPTREREREFNPRTRYVQKERKETIATNRNRVRVRVRVRVNEGPTSVIKPNMESM